MTPRPAASCALKRSSAPCGKDCAGGTGEVAGVVMQPGNRSVQARRNGARARMRGLAKGWGGGILQYADAKTPRAKLRPLPRRLRRRAEAGSQESARRAG